MVFPNVKGQMMLMMAIIIVLVVIAIRIEADSVSTIESFDFQRGGEHEAFDNVLRELATSGRLAFTENPDGAYVDARLSNFTAFVRKKKDVSVIYAVVSYKPSNRFNVTVRNYLGDEMVGVLVEHNVSGSATSASLGSLAIGAFNNTTATSAVASERPVEVNVSYTTRGSGENFKHTFTAIVGPAYNYTTVYAQMTLKSGDSSLSDAFAYTLVANSSSAAAYATPYGTPYAYPYPDPIPYLTPYGSPA
ncbi:MAG: hypothetical protein HYS81_02695 [Candidatus Aenigmatarchaeota archaeon]|nr:MAG: hypothetical protein HYS81_02695 [Candidatus Aenigmarchaeota archaeon]